MSDKTGIRTAAEKGIKLGEIGQRIVLENEHVRVWEINLDPGETIDFHIHFHPYLVISLGGGENEIETIFGDKITVERAARFDGLHQRHAAGAPADQPRQGSLPVASDRTQERPLDRGVRNSEYDQTPRQHAVAGRNPDQDRLGAVAGQVAQGHLTKRCCGGTRRPALRSR